ncbi:MAG: 4Fe-4S binding protein [Fibrobacteres bacterium]|jgi:formate hydrogenlyase subunit 6/NADH:ubiquinone oxidoreductase subunit I|nr:4Fe-4S binding protein [Fibrobacterota bacterium]
MSILGWVREIVDGVESTTTGLGMTARFIWENVTDKEGQANAMTLDYPAQPAHIPDGFRGHLFNDVDRCTLCKSCSRACPIDCITMEGELNENSKFRISRYDIDLSKCIYCGLCTQVCPTDCLTMTKGYELDPKNLVNARGGKFLFRMRADQTKVRLDMQDVDRLNLLTSQDPSGRSEDDRQFMSRIEDLEKGQFLFARYGMGFYTPEEKAKADQTRADRKKAREQAAAQATQLAAEQAAQQSDKAPGSAGT